MIEEIEGLIVVRLVLVQRRGKAAAKTVAGRIAEAKAQVKTAVARIATFRIAAIRTVAAKIQLSNRTDNTVLIVAASREIPAPVTRVFFSSAEMM